MANLFKELESESKGVRIELSRALDAVKFDAAGLVPAIAQEASSGSVLMLAWMNRTAIEQTLSTGWVTYYSRSRAELWRKGATSGHLQRLQSLHLDCDGDAVLVRVEQTGPACHTNRDHCFYLKVDGESVCIEQSPPQHD